MGATNFEKWGEVNKLIASDPFKLPWKHVSNVFGVDKEKALEIIRVSGMKIPHGKKPPRSF